MENLSAYKNFSKYYNLMMSHRNHYQAIADLLNDLMPEPDLKVLDAACGQGNSFYFDNSKNWTIYGNDGSKEMLEFLEKDFRLFSKYKSVFNYNWEHLDSVFNCEKDFDLIFFLGNSISHIDSAESLGKLFSSIYDGLADEGKLIFDLRNWQFNTNKTTLFEPERAVNVKRKLLEDTLDKTKITISDFCYYDADRQIIEYIIEDEKETLEKIEFSYLMLQPTLIYQMLSDLRFKVKFSGMPKSYPYYIFLAEK